MTSFGQLKVYFLVSNLLQRRIEVRGFARDLLRGSVKKHIRNNWFPRDRPVGGVKTCYQHCQILRELGAQADILCLGKYHGNFFGYDLLPLRVDDVGYDLKDSVLVVPEFDPYLSNGFRCAKKIMFVQAQPYLNLNESDQNKVILT